MYKQKIKNQIKHFYFLFFKEFTQAHKNIFYDYIIHFFLKRITRHHLSVEDKEAGPVFFSLFFAPSTSLRNFRFEEIKM